MVILEALGVERGGCIVVLGKGGVGKTTFTILSGLEGVEKGLDTLVASMDPAAHLQQYLRLGRRNRVVKVDGLKAIQFDFESLADRLANEYSVMLQRLLPALNTLSSSELYSVVREAPGFEEEVYLAMLKQLLLERGEELVVIDTPPTGVALRVLRLPRVYEKWTRILLEIRLRIVSLRKAIASARGDEFNPHDPVVEKLEEMGEVYKGLWRRLESCRYVIVSTPEPLPVSEAIQTTETLEKLGLSPTLIVLNRFSGWNESAKLLDEWRCRTRSRPKLLVIGEAPRPPSRLGDVAELRRLIVGVHACS